MTVVNLIGGAMTLSVFGKKKVAESMYARGGSFLGAALLLRKQGGYEYVVLHLICQGIEIILKGLLLHKDYDKYKPQLKKNKKNGFGHDLEKIAAVAVSEFTVRNLKPDVEAELKALNSLYSEHYLRYGSGYDILVDPTTIKSNLVLRKIYAVLRLARRHLRSA